jgi:SAM-dependent methyltransferase
MDEVAGRSGIHDVPDRQFTSALEAIRPGDALDLASGRGRHAQWLKDQNWNVTAVDQLPDAIDGVRYIQADLEKHEYRVEPDSWDLIVCWLYWQPDLLPEISTGLRKDGVVALAGKTAGRFATSLQSYRKAFAGWEEIASGENESRAFFIARKKHVD